MRPLSSAACLELWERGQRLHSLDRALFALSFGLPDTHPESLADWPLGRRNQALLELHASCFGPALEAWTSCEDCGEKLELTLDAMDLLGEGRRYVSPATEAPAVGAAATGPSPTGDPLTVVVGGRAFRLPSSRDLAHLAAVGDPRSAALGSADSGLADPGSLALHLTERCAVDAQPVLPENLPEIEQALAAADPLAEIRIALLCPTCSLEWEEPLDVTSFLWAEIESSARLLLRDIHTLAFAYGWSESDILALSEARRRLYLDMIEAMNDGQPRLEALPSRVPQRSQEAFF